MARTPASQHIAQVRCGGGRIWGGLSRRNRGWQVGQDDRGLWVRGSRAHDGALQGGVLQHVGHGVSHLWPIVRCGGGVRQHGPSAG